MKTEYEATELKLQQQLPAVRALLLSGDLEAALEGYCEGDKNHPLWRAYLSALEAVC